MGPRSETAQKKDFLHKSLVPLGNREAIEAQKNQILSARRKKKKKKKKKTKNAKRFGRKRKKKKKKKKEKRK